MRFVIAMLLMLPTLVQAQHIAAPAARVDTVIVYAPMGPGALAETSCLGGRIYQVMDMSVIGTELEDEIVVHENKHAEQILRMQIGLTAIGDAGVTTPLVCPAWPNGLRRVMIEIEAFCTSWWVRVGRGSTIKEADEYNLDLLTRGYNFGPGVTPAMIQHMYHSWCG
jgi:hypothetical protein